MMLAITYNYFTFFYFLSIGGFPSGIWLMLELLSELALIFDLFLNMFLRLMHKKIWRRLYLLRSATDTKWYMILANIVAILPSSFILVASNVEERYLSF